MCTDVHKSNNVRNLVANMPICLSKNHSTTALRRNLFRPLPYLFLDMDNQMVQMTPDECISQCIRCPDFHVLLDHAIAVLWLCYAVHPTHDQYNHCSGTEDSLDDNNVATNTDNLRRARERLQRLSPIQLQWAIRFLQTIRNEDGQQSIDICAAIEKLQLITFEKYANVPTSSSTVVSSTLNGSATGITKSCISMQNIDDLKNNLFRRMAIKLNQLLTQICPDTLTRFISWS